MFRYTEIHVKSKIKEHEVFVKDITLFELYSSYKIQGLIVLVSLKCCHFTYSTRSSGDCPLVVFVQTILAKNAIFN